MNLEEARQKLTNEEIIFLTGSRVTRVNVSRILDPSTEESERGILFVVKGEFMEQALIRGIRGKAFVYPDTEIFIRIAGNSDFKRNKRCPRYSFITY
ncbi:MAG: hypothetical protein U9M90_02785 [Patescibacteria group bacterium]|nr:hypothetical protein [Patescibacteria group bacterium]